MKTTAIVLAAGSGSRMHSEEKKQFMMLHGRPLIYYALSVFETCECIDDIVLVCTAGEEARCREEILLPYQFRKVKAIVPGGKERFHSVYEGLKAAGAKCGTVLIHDGARPFPDHAMIRRLLEEAAATHACVAAMPVKDTIKLSDQNGFVQETPPRDRLWMIQTPQVFDYPLIMEAYQKIMEGQQQLRPTDDAMVLEYAGGPSVKLVKGSYENLKITTPEDLIMAEAILGEREKCESEK